MQLSRFPQYQIGAETEIPSFQSKDKDLNEFLMSDAKEYLAAKMAVTYIVVDNTVSKTVAYYSLLNDKVTFDPEKRSFWNRLNRRIPNKKRRKDYPAVKIGRLAVSGDYAGLGIGREIVDMIKFMFSHGNRTGCRFVTVDAYAEAVNFYRKCGFEFLTDRDQSARTRAMYFDLLNFQIAD